MSRVGIVAPMILEARLIDRTPSPGGISESNDNTLVCVSGVGRDSATRAAKALLERGARALVSFGLAGGLDPALPAGALVLPSRVLATDGSEFEADTDWLDGLRRRLGQRARAGACAGAPAALLESAEWLMGPAEKLRAHASSGAIAADMESAALARVGAAAGVPFVVARAICDTASLAMPGCVRDALSDDGRARIGALLLSLARRPQDLGALWRLTAAFRAARSTLAELVRVAGLRFAFPRAEGSRIEGAG